ncbi:signal transduction histidine kinase [Pseudarthrobacter oxydans]|uniref:sensor histidine kinase n=1 Tax=Pseudarthrobacter oxydans TaxID=1671 RepID=UPI00277FE5CF|nr:HAMP domain-containing sensor histidine kinase [Pseudarthrobacter oxydans]MDP9984713.1 signal transduction histidine kinase [Pseudarthrobacter oxydans]
MAVVAVAMLTGGLLLLQTLESALVSSTDSLLRSKVQDVAVLIQNDHAEDANRAVAGTVNKDPLVQILNRRGTVVAASEPRLLEAPLSSLRPAAEQIATENVSAPGLLGDADERYLVVLGVEDEGSKYWVLAGRTIQPQSDTVRIVTGFLLIAMPLLLAVVGLSVHFLVGRSLRQVDTIRTQVSHIDASRLSERVDVPRTGDELQALAATMNSMLDRIETADQRQRQFVSNASHELRSPLTTIRTGLDISIADASGKTWRGMQPILAEETQRLQDLVEDLLTLSKADDEGLAVRREDVDLDDVLATELRRVNATSKHRIVADLVPARIAGDPARLSQAFRNVLDNADRHAAGTIAVKLSVMVQTVVVTIDDDGTPVPVADRERIFGRFVRLDESRSRHRGGSGLGLAIARGIVEAHDGRVIATETTQGWCRFEVSFPQMARPAAAPHADLPIGL